MSLGGSRRSASDQSPFREKAVCGNCQKSSNSCRFLPAEPESGLPVDVDLSRFGTTFLTPDGQALSRLSRLSFSSPGFLARSSGVVSTRSVASPRSELPAPACVVWACGPSTRIGTSCFGPQPRRRDFHPSSSTTAQATEPPGYFSVALAPESHRIKRRYCSAFAAVAPPSLRRTGRAFLKASGSTRPDDTNPQRLTSYGPDLTPPLGIGPRSFLLTAFVCPWQTRGDGREVETNNGQAESFGIRSGAANFQGKGHQLFAVASRVHSGVDRG